MNPILQNVLAVVAGLLLGSIANFAFIYLGMSIVPLPEGVNVMDPESLSANIGLFQPKHFIFPFLAHAIGTLAGAWVAARIAATRKMTFAWVVGLFFLAGGLFNAFTIPAPFWFLVLDLILAYFPMAWLGGRLAISKK